MNIVLYNYAIDNIGGAQVGTRRLAEALAQRGHKITLLTTQSISRWLRGHPTIEHVNSLRIIRLPVFYKGQFRSAERMMLVETLVVFPLLMRNAQILHIRKLDAEAINLGWIAHRWKVKTLVVPMGSGVYGDIAKFPTAKAHDTRNLDWLSALTEDVRQEAVAWGFPLERTGVISNGVDTAFFAPPAEEPKTDRVVYTGQFREEKRVGLLLEAWCQVQMTHPNAQLALIGGAEATPKYQQLASELGIKPTFVIKATSEQLRNHLQNSSIFVLPSVSEGMSNSLLEAMSVGLACVVSDNPGNRALIVSEINGIVVADVTPHALAVQLRRLLDDRVLRGRLGAAARQTIVRNYSLDAVVDKYIDLYHRIVETRNSDDWN